MKRTPTQALALLVRRLKQQIIAHKAIYGDRSCSGLIPLWVSENWITEAEKSLPKKPKRKAKRK